MAFPNPEQVYAAVLIGKDDIIAVPERLQPDIRAGALQHEVGLSFEPKGEQVIPAEPGIGDIVLLL